MTKVTYTLKPNVEVGVARLALWVKTKLKDSPCSIGVLPIARRLIAGGSWSVDSYEVRHPQDAGLFCSVLGEHESNEYEALFRQWDEHAALLNRAVAGDAEAAVEYCKLEKAGKIHHGAFAG